MATAPIYMDNHATTRVDPRVVESMLPYFTEKYGNPASIHALGWEAKEGVDKARHEIAAAIGASDKELVFTSGATESNNLALRGVAERPRRKGNHLVSVSTEHPSVLDPLARLARRGYEVTLVGVEPAGSPRAGIVHPEAVAEALRDETLLVSVMLANNEIGAIHPLTQIGALCKQRGVLLHCDATQAVGKIPVDVETLQVDLMSFTAHKIYGPKGIGVLYVRRHQPSVRLEPLVAGGGHQRGVRSGTLNVPGIVGLARAITLCSEELASEAARLAQLRMRLFEGITQAVDDVALCGPALQPPELRLPGNLTLSFGDVDGEALLMGMGDVAVSSGAACTSATPEPSHVLRALGLPEDAVRSSLRFGLGRFNTEQEAERAVERVGQAVERLRAMKGPV